VVDNILSGNMMCLLSTVWGEQRLVGGAQWTLGTESWSVPNFIPQTIWILKSEGLELIFF
jgi:hypothetical protein